MNTNSTFVGRTLCAILIFSFNFFTAKAQGDNSNNCVAPAMTYHNAVLISGTPGSLGAMYVFPEVTPGVHAHFTITDIVGGATLTSIDDMTYGYSAAWQPVVKTPVVQGASESYISFKIEFFDEADNDHDDCEKHKYDCAQLSFIDVDGDNQHVREFVAARGFDSYTVADISVLTLTESDQGSHTLLQATGTYANYGGIDTASYLTNINFKFKNVKKIEEVRIGSATDSAFTVQDRFTCAYFKQISMPATVVMPVKYLSFDATATGSAVLLNWITAMEITSSHFEVERSFDGNNFKTIGLVLDALEISNDKKTYKFKDNSLELKDKTIAYYRLKQIDRDGSFSKSNVLMVRLQGQQNENVKMTVSPNPFVERLTISFEATASGLAEIKIMNVSGQTVLLKQANVIKGYNNLQAEGLSKLNAGIYVAHVLINGTVIGNQKIVKN